MRTVEEIKEWVEARRMRNCGAIHQIEAETLDAVLEFIDSEPPCRHARIKYVGEKWCMDDRCGQQVTFCPDCGKNMEEYEDD